VFTPTYNRAKTLKRTYDSLCAQTNKNFLWLIIDDGSTDHTQELVQSWMKKANGFPIEYYKKENGGMHTAHNLAYAKIKTELNVCVDSDDLMPPNAIELILSFWNAHKSSDVAGIIALDADLDGQVIGTIFPDNVSQASTVELYQRFGAKGDKKLVYRTDAINSVEPYPEFQGEKLVPLGYKYTLVDQKYKMLLMNEIVCLVEYQPDGSTNTIFRQYMQSPKGFAVANKLDMQYSIKKTRIIKSVVHYVAECRIAHDKNCIRNSPRKFLTILFYPFGFMAEMYIKYVNWESSRK
jgi:glycosyltransferase involved in cell wall biosynthesis